MNRTQVSHFAFHLSFFFFNEFRNANPLFFLKGTSNSTKAKGKTQSTRSLLCVKSSASISAPDKTVFALMKTSYVS